MANAAAIATAFGGGLPPGITGTNDRCRVLVANLNPDVSTLSLREVCLFGFFFSVNISFIFDLKFVYFRELTRTNCSTCSPFMGTLSELNFSEINQIMHLSRWGMVSKLSWQYTF